LALVAVAAVGVVVVSGGSDADPRTPVGLAGLPPPFLGTAVAGAGELTAAVDSYGDVVDLRPSPAGRALIDNPWARQSAGTVPADTGIVPRISVDSGPALPLWRADSVSQQYLPGTNVVRTVARFGPKQTTVTVAARKESLAVVITALGGGVPEVSVTVEDDLRCARERRAGQLNLLCRVGRAVPPVLGAAAGKVRRKSRHVIQPAAAATRGWLSQARPLGPGAPPWARRLYERSLLTLRALTDRRTGAVAAGARDGWAYVWPRDAATAALALQAAGFESEARQVVRFLAGLDLSTAARFDGQGEPVPGRGPQGDAPGWIAVAAREVGAPVSEKGLRRQTAASGKRPDYQEGAGGEYLGNMIAATATKAAVQLPAGLGVRGEADAQTVHAEFYTPGGLVRKAHDPASGLDSAAAWAVWPFKLPSLYPLVNRTLLALSAEQTRFGITPGSGWTGGVDPWSAPTAWAAGSFAALAASAASTAAAHTDRRQALRLLADLRRAATPAGALPERVDAETGVPRSTTPLAWSHAFVILALRRLWATTS
jgi:hypothetical protein